MSWTAGFSLKPQLNLDRGTAILVAASIHDACHYLRLFRNMSFGRHCGIVTSYEPNHNAISREPVDSDERYKFDTYTQHVLARGQTTKQYEDEAKRRFIEEPANMKLLIVVSKLLIGFDAPSCTYIYLDNELRDHHLFQAVCRTNRLDGDDKDYGHIVDFKELFDEVQEAIAFHSSDELDTDEGNGGDNNVHPYRSIRGIAVVVCPISYFPMQNLPKISPKRSSAVNSPVIAASERCASRNSSA